MTVWIVMDCQEHTLFGGFETVEIAQASIKETFKGFDAVPFFTEMIIDKEWLAMFAIKGKIVGQIAIRRCEIHSIVTPMKGAIP